MPIDRPERRLPVLRQQRWEQDRATVEGTFPLGQLYATPGALQEAGDALFAILARHARGDWGDVGDEDWRSNDRALVSGTRLLSAYRIGDGTKVWVLTEADRSSTTALLPEEY